MKKYSNKYEEIPMSLDEMESKPKKLKRASSKKKRKGMRRGSGTIIFLLVVIVGLIGVLYYMWNNDLIFDTLPNKKPTIDPANVTATPEPTITLGELQSWENPILKKSRFTQMYKPKGDVDAKYMPDVQGVKYSILSSNSVLPSFMRDYELFFQDPIRYQKVPGVLSFRGNNFRNAPSYGVVSFAEKKIEQIWERQVGGLQSSKWSFRWSGTGWTGQPVIIKWDDDVRELMNIYESKKNKSGLVEVVYATMDGNIYFYDLDDGKSTRDPINIKAPIKGTPAIDPRGYPILYVGQGDNAPPDSSMKDIGMRIFSLIDGKLLHFIDGNDPLALRTDWGACDSSPIIDGESDTLVWGSENGILYTAKLNTAFDKQAGTISINPVFTNMRYESSATTLHGIESSPAIYGKYAYWGDNSGILSCVDLMTMSPVWTKPLDDDTDVTPVLSHESDGIYLYTGTEVDFQKRITGTYLGDAFVYKIDALTGKTMWRNSQKCWTKNDEENVGNDINGGVMGTPIVGKNNIDNLVIFSFCMTNGLYSGNILVAFDKKGGQVVWSYPSGRYTWSSPVDVYDENGDAYIILADTGSNLMVLNGSNGKELFVGEIKKGNGSGGIIESSPAVYNDTLVIGTRTGVIAGMKLK